MSDDSVEWWPPPTYFCWVCDEAHEPPPCLPGTMTDMRELMAELAGEREPRLLIPAWHDRSKGEVPTFGWSSDKEWALTAWAAHDNGYV